jgi:hypothetical protein
LESESSEEGGSGEEGSEGSDDLVKQLDYFKMKAKATELGHTGAWGKNDVLKFLTEEMGITVEELLKEQNEGSEE